MTGAGGTECGSAGPMNRYNAFLAAISDYALDRPHNTDVASATAEIPTHGNANRAFVVVCRAQNDIAARHQHTRRAIAALQGVLTRKRCAQLLHDIVLVEALDRRYFGMGAGRGISDAGARRYAIDKYGAGAAHTMLTSKMGAGEIVRVANVVGEAGPRLHVGPNRNAIEGERHVGHANTA
jgi:hypothetical protein